MLKRHPISRNPLRRALDVTRGIIASTILFGLLFVTNAVQCASIVFAPVSPRLTRWINRWSAHFWWGTCVFVLENFYRLKLVFTGDRLPERENAIVISNHQQMSDIPALMCLAWRKGRLGDLKWIVKDPLKFAPGVGWGLYFLGCVFVKRNWAEDKAKVESSFAHIHRNRIPMWLVAFPEGTRITEKKLERSRAFAKKAGLFVPEGVLLPRTKGFVASVEGLQGHAGAVYDITIGFPSGIPTLWQLFEGVVPEIHLHCRRYALSSLPTGSDALASWLMRIYAEKDARMIAFRREGRFEGAAYSESYWGGSVSGVKRDTGTGPDRGAFRENQLK